MKLKKRLPLMFKVFAGVATYTANGFYVPDCRRQLAVGPLPWASDEWGVWHIASGRSLVFNCPSRAYALKIMAGILPHVNLMKLARGDWDSVKESLPEWVDKYLADVWKLQPKIDEIPKVDQWRNSKSLSNGPNHSRGKTKTKVKIRRRRG